MDDIAVGLRVSRCSPKPSPAQTVCGNSCSRHRTRLWWALTRCWLAQTPGSNPTVTGVVIVMAPTR